MLYQQRYSTDIKEYGCGATWGKTVNMLGLNQYGVRNPAPVGDDSDAPHQIQCCAELTTNWIRSK